MGYNSAVDLSESPLAVRTQLKYHLTGNHYPPVPASMVDACLDAIDAYHDEDFDRLIKLPEGVSWRGKDSAPANAIAEAHHLDPWLPHAHYCDCEECIGAQDDQ
jgi:hypothetical protein